MSTTNKAKQSVAAERWTERSAKKRHVKRRGYAHTNNHIGRTYNLRSRLVGSHDEFDQVGHENVQVTNDVEEMSDVAVEQVASVKEVSELGYDTFFQGRISGVALERMMVEVKEEETHGGFDVVAVKVEENDIARGLGENKLVYESFFGGKISGVQLTGMMVEVKAEESCVGFDVVVKSETFDGSGVIKEEEVDEGCGDIRSYSQKQLVNECRVVVEDVMTSTDFRIDSGEGVGTRTKEHKVPDTRCDVCLRYFIGVRGLRAHLARSDCRFFKDNNCDSEDSNHCSPLDSNPVPQVGQDNNHSPSPRYELDSERSQLTQIMDKLPINWPGLKERDKWDSLDSKVMTQLPPNMSWQGRLNLLQRLVYEEAKSLFGCRERGSCGAQTKNRRERLMMEVRQRIRNCVSSMKEAVDDNERAGWACLLDELKEQRRKIRRAENTRKKRWRRKKQRRAFYDNPFQASKDILCPRSSCELDVAKSVLDEYAAGVAKDDDRENDLGVLHGLPECPLPELSFKTDDFDLKHFEGVLKKKRNSSRPGPNQLPYKVYKLCPQLMQYLFEIFQSALAAKSVPLCWRVSDGIMIPKVAKPDRHNITDYRQIALLNVEGKLFWSMVADRLYRFLIDDNKYISTTIQKGSVRRTAGCWEHTSMVWSALKDARRSRKSVSVLWLDLANAYGSVPHKLIVFALRRYHVPEAWIDLLMAYYDGLWGRSSGSGVYSEWFCYKRGIFAGCTVSVILFLVAFNVILEYVGRDGLVRYQLANGSRIEVLRGFMDDLSVLSPSVAMTRLALERTEKVLSWARMKLKPSKSRSLVVHRGRVMEVEPFVANGEAIPCLQRKPLRTLGRVFDCSITDRHARETLERKIRLGLTKLDKSMAKGFMKLWALHHILLPQIRWDFMVYEIPMSWVEKIEKTMNRFVRKWLGVNRSLTDVALYSKNSPCPLPFTSLVQLFKSTRVNSYLQLANSSDNQVRKNAAPLSTGRKWKLYHTHAKFGVTGDLGAITSADSKVHMERVVGTVRKGNSGIGFVPSTAIPAVGSKGERRLRVSKVMEEAEDEYMVKAVSQSLQGQWTHWTQYHQRNIKWRSFFYSDLKLIRFCLGATFNTLASPANLKRWNMTQDATCTLCGMDRCTVIHVLSKCKIALSQGRYTYRHNAVLRCLAHPIQAFINTNHAHPSKKKIIHFVTAGAKPKKSRYPMAGILHQANDWTMQVDLSNDLKFPEHIVDSTFRPDIVIHSNHLKAVILIELTCPCEERFQVSHQAKLDKYDSLVSDCQQRGWQVHCFAVEVGARGYVARTLEYCLKSLGLSKKTVLQAVKEAGDVSLRCSFWIWVCRDRAVWENGAAGDGTNSASYTQPRVSTHRRSSVSKQPKGNTIQGATPVKPVSTSATSDPSTFQTTLVMRRGLRNLGNSCYLNAVFQCMFNVLSLCHVSQFSAQSSLLGSLFSSLYHSVREGGAPTSPAKFKRLFGRSKPQFGNNNQQDAHEFFLALLDALNEVTVSSLFLGQFQSSVHCNFCKNTSMRWESFNCVELDVASDGRTSMQHLLHSFSKPETLFYDSGWTCGTCAGSNGTKTLTFHQLPNCLVLVVRRFVFEGAVVKKVATEVTYDAEIEVAGVKYEVTAVVYHTGVSPNSGHYQALLRVNGTWVNCNDAIVNKEPNGTSRSKEIYMAFYQRSNAI